MLVRFLFLVLLLGACRSDNNVTNANGDTQESNFDIKTRWKVESTTCGETSLAARFFTDYRFDNSHFIRIESEEFDDGICTFVYVYERFVTGLTKSDSTLTERGILRGSKAKRRCSDRKNISSVSNEEVISFGPEEFNYSLLSSDNRMTMSIYKSRSCTDGELKLDLVQMSQ